jgi:hypothetical protein
MNFSTIFGAAGYVIDPVSVNAFKLSRLIKIHATGPMR